MKKLLFVFPIVALLAAGCNSSQQTSNQASAPTPVVQNTTPTTAPEPKPTPTPNPTPTPSPAPVLANMKTYTNTKWSYSVEYPSNLLLRESEDRSGQGYGSVTNVFIINSNVKAGHQIYISTQDEINDQFKNGGYGLSIQAYTTPSGQSEPTGCDKNNNETSVGNIIISGITVQKCKNTQNGSYETKNGSISSLTIRFYNPKTGINYQLNTDEYFTPSNEFSVTPITQNILDQIIGSFKILN